MTLSWWGSAHATGYDVKRATKPGGPYVTIGTANATDTFFTDTKVTDGNNYYYVVSAQGPDGESATSAELKVAQSLASRYDFDGNAKDTIGTNGATVNGAPNYAPGKVGAQAIALDGADDYVTLPKGVANFQDVTIAAWVYWDGGGNFQRIFDFGSEVEANMFLTPKSNIGKLLFSITTTRAAEGSGTLEAPALPANEWAHVAITLNGDTGTLYVNGKAVAAGTVTLDPLFAQTNCYIGKSQYPDPLFKGRIDDFRIYNYALSGEQVAVLAKGN
ncbi:hypothetical protein IAD21_05380 [Abditibacteriota bacterium]|nr:hypothetical protein IAD21_05380 [Abditibacteriota bacterium]